MVTVTKKFSFEASHHLPYYKGECHNLHGHSYTLEVTVCGKVISDKNNPKCGMIVDFKDLKYIIDNTIIKTYDHSNLNDYFDNPTAEIMVEKIGETISRYMDYNKLGCKLIEVKLWETTTSYATYIPTTRCHV